MISVRPAKKLPSLVKPRDQSAAPPTAKAALHPGDEFTGIYGCAFPVKYVKMIYIYIYMYVDYIVLLYTIYSTVLCYILLLCTIFYCYVLALVLIHSHIYEAVTIGPRILPGWSPQNRLAWLSTLLLSPSLVD